MSLWVWVYAVACPIMKNWSVSCQMEIQTYFLKSLCSTSPRLAPKVHPCYANSTQKSLKRLSGNLFLVVASQKMINSHKYSYTSRKGNVESGEDENSEEESEDQSRDIDLMGSDNEEDEEEIELENEKDCAFLDDEIQEQEDVSFYRRFHVELNRGLRQEQRQQRQELATYEDMLFGKEQTSEKMSASWQGWNIDMFKDGISVPGLTLKYCQNK